MRILIVEDEVMIREGLAKLIKSHTGHTVAGEASNGQEGLNLALRLRPELVITDIRMPVMDGLEACRAIRKLERADAAVIPIIAMTANSFKDDADAAAAAGMNGFVTKPVDVDYLYHVLNRVMNNSRQKPHAGD